ncbi:MAG: hypothetical protein A4C66_13235 [Nitrospira sp. HN-bin3]|uniref:hypothetical protein n=1 Tax=Nitrospira cf. moscoviensis SBR1015 TaxID=96242 RepID=UPI000A0E312E|nr:hypothetical protein [Nitrospira cf. moscoviensis SBR1015]OQW33694.1 MAG: hypothetical protein A4C66_13235 [Nitrospira sp. HN-bin3]
MKRLRTRSGLVVGLFWLLIADMASAGDYALVVGKGIDVCEAYLKNLNSFPNDPPMVCERKVNPKFPEFSKPVWQPMDAVENLGLLEQIERQKLHREEEYIRNREKLIAWFKEHIASGRIRLALANIDFERNGTTANEAVLQYERADCDPANESNFAGLAGRAFYVLDPEKVQIDVEKSKSISFYDRADIFLFKERVYLTHWGGDLGFRNGTLSVASPLHAINYRTRCDYRYKAHSSRRHP